MPRTYLTSLVLNKIYAVKHNTRNIFTSTIPIVITKELDEKTGLLKGYALNKNLIDKLATGDALTPLELRPDEFNGVALNCKPFPIRSDTMLKPYDVIKYYTGGVYVVLHIAMNESTLQSKCVYVALSDGKIWERPLNEIFEQIGDKSTDTRFKLFGNLKDGFDIDYSEE